LGYEQVFSPVEYRSDAASAAECALPGNLIAQRPTNADPRTRIDRQQNDPQQKVSVDAGLDG